MTDTAEAAVAASSSNLRGVSADRGGRSISFVVANQQLLDQSEAANAPDRPGLWAIDRRRCSVCLRSQAKSLAMLRVKCDSVSGWKIAPCCSSVTPQPRDLVEACFRCRTDDGAWSRERAPIILRPQSLGSTLTRHGGIVPSILDAAFRSGARQRYPRMPAAILLSTCCTRSRYAADDCSVPHVPWRSPLCTSQRVVSYRSVHLWPDRKPS